MTETPDIIPGWLADASAVTPLPGHRGVPRRMRQRICGVAFRNRDDLKAHLPMLELPDGVGALLRDFLAGPPLLR